MAKRRKKPQPEKNIPVHRLIDWNCPLYIEKHPDSTPYAGVILEIHALIENRGFIWQTTFTRDLFANGNDAHWRIGTRAIVDPKRPDNPICQTFAEALLLARAELETCYIPKWRD